MTSSIIKTNPTAGTATTSSVRDNFSFASDEITALQRTNVDVETTTGGPISYSLNYGLPSIAIVDGTRVSARINAANTTAIPVLTVSPQTSPANIVKADGSALSAGDLVVDGTYDFMWNDSLSKWFCLNLSTITNQDTLLTTILGGLYPVGSLLTTTVATDPGDADYFFNGITFGTWAAYAAGRTIVGLDTGTTITSASSSSNVVTLVVASHSLSAGDSIVVSGFTSDTDANGTFTVDSTTSTNIVYTATNVSDGALAGTDLLVKNAAFDTAQEVGGSSNNTLSLDQMPSHRHGGIYPAGSSGGFTQGFDVDNPGNGNSLANEKITAYTGGDKTDGTLGETQPQNNLQPYITTYIWKRTA
tara:strand:+ start:5145 stop:6224 length:1080 start_codon:yes stop_codon:yes gene_type:complete